MSYDLAVFDPREEFRDRPTFVRWYEARTLWADGLSYDDPSNTTPALRAWFEEMIGMFPPLNGPLRPPMEEIAQWEAAAADYSIGKDIIYVAFGRASIAYEAVHRLAAKHGVGFFDASGGGGEVWFPTSASGLEVVHQGDGSDQSDQVFARLMGRLSGETLTGKPQGVRCDSIEDAVAKLTEIMRRPPGANE